MGAVQQWVLEAGDSGLGESIHGDGEADWEQEDGKDCALLGRRGARGGAEGGEAGSRASALGGKEQSRCGVKAALGLPPASAQIRRFWILESVR